MTLLRYPARNVARLPACDIPGCALLTGRLDQLYSRPVKRMYVLDHCARHGWVRGNVCQSCNNRISRIEYGKAPMLYPAWSPQGTVILDYREHLKKCSECTERL